MSREKVNVGQSPMLRLFIQCTEDCLRVTVTSDLLQQEGVHEYSVCNLAELRRMLLRDYPAMSHGLGPEVVLSPSVYNPHLYTNDESLRFVCNDLVRMHSKPESLTENDIEFTSSPDCQIIGKLLDTLATIPDDDSDLRERVYSWLAAVISQETRNRTETDLAKLPISSLGFSVRATNVLDTLNAKTVGDMRSISKQKLAFTRNCGETTIKEITNKLKQLGIVLHER